MVSITRTQRSTRAHLHSDPGATGTGEDRFQSDLRILFVIDQLIEMGGAELALLRLVRGLKVHGLSPAVITFRPLSDAALQADWPCAVQVLPLRRALGWEALGIAWEIRRYIRLHRINVVHTFFESSDLFAGSVARTVPGVALVTSRRDMGILRNSRHRFLYRRLAGLAHRVVAVSNSVRQWCVLEDRLPSARVVTVYNGVQQAEQYYGARSELRRQLELGPDQIVITAIGHLRRVKGFDVLIETARRLIKTAPDAFILIIGDEHEAGLRSELEQRIKFNQLENHVRLLSARKDVPALLNASDIFVLPSRSEGFSNALIEAMMAGLPCVATSVGGNAEALVAGKTGFLVPSENSDAMADALALLAQSPALRARMGQAGRAIALEHFTETAMIESMLRLYCDARIAQEGGRNDD